MTGPPLGDRPRGASHRRAGGDTRPRPTRMSKARTARGRFRPRGTGAGLPRILHQHPGIRPVLTDRQRTGTRLVGCGWWNTAVIASSTRRRGKVFPETDRKFRSVVVNDFREPLRAMSTESQVLLRGYAHPCFAAAKGGA